MYNASAWFAKTYLLCADVLYVCSYTVVQGSPCVNNYCYLWTSHSNAYAVTVIILFQ